MNKEILFKTETETLLLIKEEGEKNLSGIQNAEEVITNKSNSLMQILIPLLILLIGFSVNELSRKSFEWKFQLSILLIILLTFVIYILYRNILPVKTAIPGTEPNELIQPDMISGNHQKDYRNILVNRVFNLQNAIQACTRSHSIRYKRFKNANRTLLIGLLLIFTIFSLYQFFVLFQDKC